MGYAVPGVTITGSNLRTRIVIPSAGARLAEVIKNAEPHLSASILTVLILGRLPSGLTSYTDRGPFIVANPRPGAAIVPDDYALRGQVVPAGEDYTSPSVGDIDAYVKAHVDTPAIAVLFW